MMQKPWWRGFWGMPAAAGLAMAIPSPASAELAISKLIVELAPHARTSDIEIYNDSSERAFVVAEPREILHPGRPSESVRVSPDPEALGLLVSPTRMILEPKQRRTMRVARLGPNGERERIYRVTVKPVVGDVSGAVDGLKLLVGYDLLVIARPAHAKPNLQVTRTGMEVAITNHGNSSVELTSGEQCAAAAKSCQPLPAKRLYAGATWRQILSGAGPGRYRVRAASGWSELRF